MIKTNVFKSKMALHCDTIGSLSEALNLSPATVCDKINGKTDFKQSEIKLLINRYKLTADEVEEIFFKGD